MSYATTREWIVTQLGELKHGSTIIDVGAGECQYRGNCTHLEYTSQDFCKFDPSIVLEGEQNGKWDYNNINIVSDITSIPVKANSFDAVLCTDVMEHVPDPVKTLKELGRILKKGGTLILTAPFCAMNHQAPYFHSSGYSNYFYEHHLSKGWDIKEIKNDGGYFDWIHQECERMLSGRLNKYLSVDMDKRDAEILESMKYLMNGFRQADTGSHEFLPCGWWVKAVKK